LERRLVAGVQSFDSPPWRMLLFFAQNASLHERNQPRFLFQKFWRTENQPKHHATKTFREEYIELLEKFGVDYDQRYILKTDDD
jgi:hypothetical protein